MIALILDVAIAVSSVSSIEVRCGESSLHGPEKAALSVKRAGAAYSDGKRTLDAKLIADLMAALQPSEFHPEELAPTVEELREAAVRWADSRRAPKALRAKILKKIEDHARVVEGVRWHYKGNWTDDYPMCRLELALDGGKKVSAESKDQHAFMIPWQLGESKSWSPHIGRALAAIVPEGFLQRDRLLGSRLADHVVDWLGDERFNP